MGCIYVLKNKVNGKMYVGQTVNVKQRFAHYKSPSHLKNKTAIASAIKKYEWANLDKYIYKDIPEEFLDYFEKELIKKLNTISPNGYNLQGGGNKNKHIHPESIQKRKITMSLKPKQVAWNKGKPLSDNQKEHLRKINIGKRASKETKEKISKKLKGRIFTDEHRKKISENRKGINPWADKLNPAKGIKRSKEYCDRMKIVHKGLQAKEKHPLWGKHHSEETKKKIGLKNKGRQTFSGKHHTEESKKKMKNRNGIKIKCVETGKIYGSILEGAKDIGASMKDVWRCLRNKKYTCHKYHWEYYKEEVA